MMTATPRDSAPETYSIVSFGVRCADRTRLSWGMSNCVNTASACCIVSQSDLLPIIMTTSGLLAIVISCLSGIPHAVGNAVNAQLHSAFDIFACAAGLTPGPQE